jgi:uncharacterized protein
MGRILFFLLLALAVYLGYRFWRGRTGLPPAAKTTGSLSEQMVRCESCGLNLPRSDALPSADGTRWFCSDEHRRDHGKGA